MKQLLSKESGTVFGSVNRNDINNLEVDIPKDIEKQEKIAGILEVLDRKIQLNTEINENLATLKTGNIELSRHKLCEKLITH